MANTLRRLMKRVLPLRRSAHRKQARDLRVQRVVDMLLVTGVRDAATEVALQQEGDRFVASVRLPDRPECVYVGGMSWDDSFGTPEEVAHLRDLYSRDCTFSRDVIERLKETAGLDNDAAKAGQSRSFTCSWKMSPPGRSDCCETVKRDMLLSQSWNAQGELITIRFPNTVDG